MATSPIVIQITDGVDPSIASKIASIGAAARESDAAIKALKTSLSSIETSGLTGLKSSMESISGSTTKVNEAMKQGASVNTAYAASTQQVTNANRNTAEFQIKLATNTSQLNAARKTLAQATKNLAEAETTLAGSLQKGDAAAKTTVAAFKSQQAAAAQLVATLKAEREPMTAHIHNHQAATKASNENADATKKVAQATHGMAPPVIAASAVIRGLEGNVTTSVRAAERFMLITLKLGPVLQAAFPVFGAFAFLGVLSILEEKIQHVVTRFHNLTIAARDSQLQLLKYKQVELEGESGVGTTLFNMFVANRPNAPKQRIPDSGEVLSDIQRQLRVKEIQSEINEAGKQGLALQKAKTQSIEDQIAATKVAIEQAKSYLNIIGEPGKKTGLLNETMSVARMSTASLFGVAVPYIKTTEEPKIPADSKQFKELTSEAKQYTHAIEELTAKVKELEARKIIDEKNEPLAAFRDMTKEAREQMKRFKEEYAQLKINAGGVVTPQAELELLNKQRAEIVSKMKGGRSSEIYEGNLAEIDTRMGVATQAIERQKLVVQTLTDRLKDQKTSIGEYSDALRIKNEVDRVNLQLQRDSIPVTEAQKKEIGDLITYTVSHAGYQRELKNVYDASNGPLRTYLDSIEAIADLEKANAVSTDAAAIARAKANLAFTNAIQPLNEYAHGLQNQVDMLGKYGREARVAAEVQRVDNDLRLKGRTLLEGEKKQLSDFLTQLYRQQEVEAGINKIHDQAIEQRRNLAIEQDVLTASYEKGYLSLENYRTELAKTAVATADLNIAIGKTATNKVTGKDILTSTIGSYLKDFKSFTQGTTDLYKQMFQTIGDGAAESLSRALVYGENLNDAFKNVARQGLQQLIGGLIKLGLQWVIMNTLGKALQTSTTASTAAAATSAAVAWAPAAALASLATLGANAAPADIALVSTTALADVLAMSSMIHKAEGGLIPGSGNRDTVPAMLMPGEFVLKASAVRAIGVSTLQAWNSRTTPLQGGASVGTYGGPNINIIHDGSTAVDVESVTASEVRLIARHEAKAAVEQHGGRVVAEELNNPNSRVSKSLKRTKETRERR